MLKSKLSHGRYISFFILLNMLVFIFCKNSIAGPGHVISVPHFITLQLTKLSEKEEGFLESYERESLSANFSVDSFYNNQVDFDHESWHVSKEMLKYNIGKLGCKIRLSQTCMASTIIKLTTNDKYRYMAIILYSNESSMLIDNNETFCIMQKSECYSSKHTISEEMNLAIALICNPTSFIEYSDGNVKRVFVEYESVALLLEFSENVMDNIVGLQVNYDEVILSSVGYNLLDIVSCIGFSFEERDINSCCYSYSYSKKQIDFINMILSRIPVFSCKWKKLMGLNSKGTSTLGRAAFYSNIDVVKLLLGNITTEILMRYEEKDKREMISKLVKIPCYENMFSVLDVAILGEDNELIDYLLGLVDSLGIFEDVYLLNLCLDDRSIADCHETYIKILIENIQEVMATKKNNVRRITRISNVDASEPIESNESDFFYVMDPSANLINCKDKCLDRLQKYSFSLDEGKENPTILQRLSRFFTKKKGSYDISLNSFDNKEYMSE